jgi:hypothetical protein
MLSGTGAGGYPPWDDVEVPKDRREDRHALPARVIRPRPKELWEQLGERVGERGRSDVISRLIAGYLAGEIVLKDEDAPPAEA